MLKHYVKLSGQCVMGQGVRGAQGWFHAARRTLGLTLDGREEFFLLLEQGGVLEDGAWREYTV